MEKRLVRRAIASVVVAGTVGAAVAASAAVISPAGPAARSPKWRITQTMANLMAGGLWAGGARDAWLAGGACADPATCGVSDTSSGTVVIRHWDGTAWRAVAPPAAYINSPLDQGAGPVVATSASDAWIFAGRGTQSADYTDALHWTGKRWAKPVRLNTAIQAAVAPSAADIWAFGPPERYQPTGYVAHYNGKTWTHGTFPIAGQAAGASSATDIWVGGVAGTMTGPLGMEHWNGRSWHSTPLPRLGAGRQTLNFIVGIAAIGPHDAWADATTDGGSGGASSYLLHWNGRSWTGTAIPYGATADSPVVPDGRGGLWLAVTIGMRRNLTYWFCHYSGGRWTKTPIPGSGTPAGLLSIQITWIPGTQSLWATGDMRESTAMYKYGP